MKKKLIGGVAGVLALSVALCASGCGKSNDPTPDRAADVFSDAQATLDVSGEVVKNDANTISDSLFGVFLEDINYAGYLLDDNLLLNGAFETYENLKTYGWGTVGSATLTTSETGGVLADQQYYGEKKVNARYGQITVSAANGGVYNAGHKQMPIAVKNNVDYLFSAFIKTETATTLTVRVTNGTLTVCEASINLKGGNTWIKYEQTLKGTAGAEEGLRLELTFADPGTYSIDGVSFETTDSTAGIKQYVYDTVKALEPKFVRFPGGCIIEGDSAAGGADCTEVYDWKNSVGAVQTGTEAGDDDIPEISYTLVKDGKESTAKTRGEWITRKQNGDLWGYDLEYGVGFLEFFELCEGIGASAVPVLNCGFSDQGGAAQGSAISLNGRHNKKVNDYIADAINLIEFAKGDKNTKWGKLRAQLGHEKPFEMDYIGIGNEQFGDYYKNYYEKFLQDDGFLDALRKYNIKPIVGNGMLFSDCQNFNESGAQTASGLARGQAERAKREGVVENVCDYGVHDQHYYVNYSVLFSNTKMYDNYLRKGDDPEKYYEVFVGEYSANEGDKNPSYPLYENSLITALSEAAMMTGFERNGDIVKLAAYAPMFGVANTAKNATTGGTSNQWAVDMMYFTNTEIVRSANYYVQQLFMKYQGTYKLRTSTLTYADGLSDTCTLVTGGTGTTNIDRLYYVTSMAKNGDILVKIVNAGGEEVKLNLGVTNAKLKGYAYLSEVYSPKGDWKAINTFANPQNVVSKSEVVSFTDGKLGQTLKPYSVTAFRLAAK